jgi:hypothetical protein
MQVETRGLPALFLYPLAFWLSQLVSLCLTLPVYRNDSLPDTHNYMDPPLVWGLTIISTFK